MKPHKGWFSIVQFCPDPNRLESANIGVLLFCPELDFLNVQLASDNRRITKFFGSKEIDLALINSFKKGLADRLRQEQTQIVSHEQLLDFADRRANLIRISPPRSIRVTKPEVQLGQLFAELVGESARHKVNVRDQLAESFDRPSLQSKLHKSVPPITVPIDGRELHVPYAFQNGRFNLIQPVPFLSENPLQTAYRYAVEGDSIYRTEHDEFGKLRLMVVGSFRSKGDQNKQIIRRVLKKHHVPLYAMDEIEKLIQEIQQTGKDVPATAS